MSNKASGTLAVLTGVLMLSSSAVALAQETTGTPVVDSLETVVVTGTSIRGIAPIGSNLITVGPKDIADSGAQTVQQVLENVPALTGLGNSGQGGGQPTIHQLGASASNSTLILVDGHRVANGSTNHTTTDPSFIPVGALERVEVLADGSSSIYGSDAVAGVINFITRKKFEGVQVGTGAAVLNGATDLSLNVLAGTAWDKGGFYAAYSYSYKGKVNNIHHPQTYPDHTAEAASLGLTGTGSTNFKNFNCPDVSVIPSGSSNYYGNDLPSGGVATNNSLAAPCTTWAYGALAGTEVRNNGMVKGEVDVTDNFTINAEMLYGSHREDSPTSRGTLSKITTFGTGARANPFFQQPTNGYTGPTVTQESVSWDADALLGPGAQSLSGEDSFYGDVTAEYKAPHSSWVVDFLGLVGHDDSFNNSIGTINTSVANLALNGTTNSSGNATTPSIINTTAVITQTLTTANALDVWDPAATNKTSAAVLAKLTDNGNYTRQVQGIQQWRLSATGPLFSVPAGDVKVALATEFLANQLYEFNVQGDSAGTNSTLSSQFQGNVNRRVYSGSAEVVVPLVAPEMNVPLIQKMAIDLSGRYDAYSDFGGTFNPKVSFDWQVIDDLKLRGNWSTSFVAPTLDILGDQDGIYLNSRYASVTNNVSVPVAAYPLVTQFGLANCTAASVTCNISSLQGIRINNGDHDDQAQKGRGWTVGADLTPTFLPGLVAHVSYWDQSFKGAITGPSASAIIDNASLQHYLTFYPGGATAAQIAALTYRVPQTSALPATVSYIQDVINGNFLNLKIGGVDASFDYSFETDNWGAFHVGDSLTQFVKFSESYGNGSFYDVLNTSGANSTFPSIATQMRANVGGMWGAFSADFFWNFVGAYRNWGSPVNAVIISPITGSPTGGGDHVQANSTFDLHLGYEFPGGVLGQDEISLTVRNILNSTPPYYNSSSGYDSASSLGRITTLGFTAKF